MKKTQIDFVKNTLREKGKITRNYCLQNYISRLAAIILILKKRGMEIDGEDLVTPNGKDYVYKLRKDQLEIFS